MLILRRSKEERLVLRAILMIAIMFGFAETANAQQLADYQGPFPTAALYDMCSRKDQASREKCGLYLQGLMYGIRTQKQMMDKDMAVCLPQLTSDEARARIVGLIEKVTAGNPSSNKDGGDWMAFAALASGNLCKKTR